LTQSTSQVPLTFPTPNCYIVDRECINNYFGIFRHHPSISSDVNVNDPESTSTWLYLIMAGIGKPIKKKIAKKIIELRNEKFFENEDDFMNRLGEKINIDKVEFSNMKFF